MRGSILIHLGRFIIALTFGLVSLLLAGNAGLAETSYVLSSRVKETYNLLSINLAVRKGLDFIKADHENTLAEQKQICTIPAPPFQEQTRAEDYRKRLTPLGLKDVQVDAEGNVFGLIPGTGKGPRLLVAARLAVPIQTFRSAWGSRPLQSVGEEKMAERTHRVSGSIRPMRTWALSESF